MLCGVCRRARRVSLFIYLFILSFIYVFMTFIGCGVGQLLDECMDTFWQSDGVQPHIVNVQFYRKTSVTFVALYIDFKVDESYTPSRCVI